MSDLLSRFSSVMILVLVACTPAAWGDQDQRPTVAALPFVDASAGARYAPLAEAIGDMLMVHLSTAEGLQFVERADISKVLAEHEMTWPQKRDGQFRLGQLVGAQFVITGSVTAVGSEFQINAHLLEVSGRRVARSAKVVAGGDRLVDPVDQLAHELVEELNLELPELSEAQIDRSPEASLHFMRGLGYYFAQMPEHATGQFMKTLAIDPAHARARFHGGLTYFEAAEYEHAKIEFSQFVEQFAQHPLASRAAQLLDQCKAMPERQPGGTAIPRTNAPPAPSDTRGSPEPSDSQAERIAVLDFVNRNPGDQRDWLGKGLADMVITDLSASDRLTVVDRERIQEITREFELGAAGILDDRSVPDVGKIARARWLLFGTFLCRGDRLSIEALLIDVTTGQTLRIEQVEGPLARVFELERSLVGAVVEKLDVPMTAEELSLVRMLRTESLPALEHHARSLGLFDSGHWYDALREAKLARRADPAYLKAAAGAARLYHEVGQPKHAMVEFRRLVELDREDSLPDEVYFRMAVVLDEALADRDSAVDVFRRILDRYTGDLPPFRITDPSRPSGGWDDVGGKGGIDKIAERNKTRLRALSRWAAWQLQADNEFQAAQLYGRIRHFLCANGMPLGNQSLGVGLLGRNGLGYVPLYWQFVRLNRDATLYPAFTLRVVQPNEEVTAQTEATHGYHQWQHGRVWLAPPGHEFAAVKYRTDTAPREDAGGDGRVQFDFRSPGGQHDRLFEFIKVKPDGSWQELKLDSGIRAIQTYVHHVDRWQMRFELRRWTEAARMPEIGGFQVNVLPHNAQLYINGKHRGKVDSGLALLRIPAGPYHIEVRWPDGRRRSTTIQLEAGRREGVCLNAGVETVSRQVIADQGSNTCLMIDRVGRTWLVWDEVSSGDVMRLSKESNLFSATTTDGIHWSHPRRLPVSSMSCDAAPVLQQDRRGMYWLVWVSERGPKSDKNLWAASSPNGVEWSFPRKISLPEEVRKDMARWRGSRPGTVAFAIDMRNVFWLVWQGWLLRSDDAVAWHVDSELHTGGNETPDRMTTKHCQLRCDSQGRLVLAAGSHGGVRGTKLWRRDVRGRWQSLAHLTDSHSYHTGGVACRGDGSMLTVTPHGSNLRVHQFAPDGDESEPIIVESYLTKPFHPSIAPLPGGKWLVVFGSNEGLVAAVFRRDQTQAATGQ